MRSLILETPKDPSTLKLIDSDLPSPKHKQIRVKMTSMGLNRGDLLYCQGRYFFQSPVNSRLGFEGAGEKFRDEVGNILSNANQQDEKANQAQKPSTKKEDDKK